MSQKFISWYRKKFLIIEIQSLLPIVAGFSILSIISTWVSFNLFIANPADTGIFLWSLLPLFFYGGLTLIIFFRTDAFSKLFTFNERFVLSSSNLRKSRYTLIITSVVILLASFGSFDSMAWWFLRNKWAEDGLRLAFSGFLAFGFGFVVFAMNKWRPGTFSRTIFIIYLMLIFGFTDSPLETAGGRSLIFQIIPVVLAGFTITPIMSVVFAAISITMLVLRSIGAGVSPNSTGFLGILLVAFISWLVASGLENSIRQVEEMNLFLEKRVALRTQQLLEANKFKSQFLAQISHELQSPIIAFTLFLRKIQSMTELKEAKALEDESLRLLDMTKSISEVSKIELETIEEKLQRKPVNIVEIINKEMFVHSLEAEEKNILLDFDQSETDCWVVGNRGYLTRVFDNLIKNAIKYTPERGKISLSTEREDGEVIIRIRDSGIGIPSAELSTIFDRFSRASNVGERSGSGLGLSMVRNMVEAMRGSVTVESIEGKGSTFTLRFPAAESTSTE